MGRQPPRPNRSATDGDTPSSGDTPTELYRGNTLSGPIKGATIANKYRLDKLIAIGGMGSVWRAHDTLLERDVAVKFMDPAIAGNEVLRRRFTREAKSAAKLRTPHVVQIIEFGVDDEVPFIVMELLVGEDLQKRLKRERRIPNSELIPIAKQIAKGLRAAHDAGVVHRDLKPQNIFLAQQDEELVVKVLDFGVAKMQDAAGEGTKAGVVVGSPHYMSPEQARGLPTLDGRSDLWSLAVILFKAITGHRPFKGDVPGDIIVKICAEPIPTASSMRKSLGPGIDAFFVKALAREPDDRFQNAVEMTDAFARAVYADRATPVPAAVTAKTDEDDETTLRNRKDAVASVDSDLPPDEDAEDNGAAGGTLAMDEGSEGIAVPPPLGSAPGGEPIGSGAEQVASDAEGFQSGATTGSISGAEPSHSGAEVATGPSFPTPGGSIPGSLATPATGASMATGFAGTLPPASTSSDELRIGRGSPSKAVIGGIAAGALLFIIVVAMAMSGDSDETGPAAPVPTSSSVTDTPWGPVVVPPAPSASTSSDVMPTANPESSAAPEGDTESPQPSATAEPSATSTAKPVPRRRRGPVRRRRSSGEDWGY